MKSYFKLLRFLKGHKHLFIVAVVIMLAASLLEGFQLPMLVPLLDRIFNNKPIVVPNNLPNFVEEFIHRINTMDPQVMFWNFLVVSFGLIMLKNILTFFYNYFMNDISQRIIRDIRNELYEKVQNLSLDYFSVKRTGELVSRITYDVNSIENAISYGLIDLFRQTFMIIIYIGTAFFIYPKAALVLFIVFPLIGYPMSKIGRKLRQLTKSRLEKMADINSLLLETISGVHVVKAFNTEKEEIERFKKENYSFYKVLMKSVKRLIVIAPMTEIFGSLCAIIIIMWLGKLVMEGGLSTGVFILFMGSIMSLISPVKKLSNVHAIIQQALSSNDRIDQILDAPITVQESKDAVDIPEMKKEIEFKDVYFRYSQDSNIVLDYISFKVKKGELVAIVGPTGVGKSTLVNLIPRFYDPVEGIVSLDAMDARKATFKSLRRQIGIVSQDTFLFNDTVKANISYGNKEATQKQVELAAQQAFADEFIRKMPLGYETIVGDRGFRLSGGQKQRLAIARAILKNAPILILDEATSQLDSESEKYVQEALDKLMEHRTVVAIAHRLSTIKKADKIIVLDKGKIVGMGKHEELLKTCDLYGRLHKMQFQA